MLTIDTHGNAGLSWYEPIEWVLFQMERNQVDRTVLIAIAGHYDNSYILQCAKRFPGRFAVVGAIDLGALDALERLTYWKAQGIVGLRLPATHWPPSHDLAVIWRKANDLNLVISCSGTLDDLASDGFGRLLAEFPDMPIVIEHLGVLNQRGGPIDPTARPKAPYLHYRKVLNLSRYPNVYMKVPPLGEFMPRPFPMRDPPFDLSDVPPFIDMAIDAFGARRMMIGLGGPTPSVREGYGTALRLLRAYLSRRPVREQEAIFGQTAASLFRFGPAGDDK